MTKTVTLNGAVALVTGANRGIGRAIVDALRAAGAKVHAGVRTVPVHAYEGHLVPDGGDGVIPLDITDEGSVQAAARALGDVDLLVNNAGVAHGQPLLGAADPDAAALSLTQGIRAELAKQGTLVVGVMPAFVDTAMAERVPGPKLPPEAVAQAIVEALRDGREDVYPGAAADIAARLQQDAKGVERQFAAWGR